MVINQKPWFSPSLHAQYTNIIDFKAFHNMSICVKKDVIGTWHKFSYLVMEDEIMGIINKWPSDWFTPSGEATGTSKATEG